MIKTGKIIAFVAALKKDLQVKFRRKQRISKRETCFGIPKMSFGYPSLRTEKVERSKKVNPQIQGLYVVLKRKFGKINALIKSVY